MVHRLRITSMDSTCVLDDDSDLCAEALAADPDTVRTGRRDPVRGVDRGVDVRGAPRLVHARAHRPAGAHGWRRFVVRFSSAMLVLSFLAITAAGLCNTYGDLHL